MRKLARLGFMFVLMLTLLVTAALPAFALQSAEILNVSFNAETCVYTVEWRTNIAESFSLFIFYDGSNVLALGGDFEAGQVITTTFKGGSYDLNNNTIGVLIEQQGNEPDNGDFIFEPSPCMSETGEWEFVAPPAADCTYPLPADSTIYSLPFSTPAFFAAMASTATGFNIPAGTWYVSQFSGDFARLWIACEASPVWVASSAVVQ